MTEKMNVPKLRFGEFAGRWSKLSFDGLNIDVIDGDRGAHYPNKEELLSEGSCLFLSAKNVTKSGFQFSEKQFITEDKDKLLRKGKLKRGDIVLTTRGSVGHKALYGETVEFDSLRINSGMVLLRHQWEELSNEFVYKSMFTRHFTKQIDVVAFGSAQPALTVKEIKKLKLSIPPSFPEQQKIASFLSKVDDKIALLTEKKDKLTEYKKGVMQQLFNGKWENQNGQMTFIPPTLRFKADDGSEFPDWEESTLGELGSFVGGGTPDTKNKDYWMGEIPWISSSDVIDDNIFKIDKTRFITDEAISESATKIVPANSILIVSRVGVGKFVVSKQEICTSQDFSNFTPKQSDITFMAYNLYVNKRKLESLAQGTSIKGFTTGDLKSLKLGIPCFEEQTKIANFLSAIDQKIDLANSELETTKEWKKGLLQQMFV